MANYTIKVSNRSGALISDPTNAPVITTSVVAAVKSIETGNGLTGGPITTTGTISVLANSGIYANSSGLFVNSAYISTLAVNSAIYLGTANLQNIQTFITSNASAAYSNAVAYVDSKSFVNSSINVTFTGIHVYSSNVTLNAGLIANGAIGSNGQILKSNGANVYWAAGGAGSVTQIDTANGLSGGPITTSGTIGIVANSGIYVNSSGVFVNTGYIATLAANSASFLGNSSGTIANVSSWITTNAASAYTNAVSYVDGKAYVNTSQLSSNLANYQTTAGLAANVAVLTSNNATFAYGKNEINLNVNNALTANSSTFLGTANLQNIQTFITTNASAAYTNAVSYVDGKSYVNTSQLSSNLANYQTTAGLAANVAVLAANSASFLGNSTGTIANISSWIATNSATAYTNAVSYVDGKSFVNTSQLSSNLANYQTTAGLASNVAVLTSNNTTFAYGKTEINLNVNNALTANSSAFLGTANLNNIQTFITTNASAAYTNAVSYVDGKAYVNTSQLSSNLANYALLTGATFSGNVRTQQSAQVDGNLIVSGNLTVTGNVTVIGANNLSVVDNMIYLNSNSAISNPDLGFAGNYNDGVYHHAGFFRDASDGVWKVFDNYLPEPDASPYIDTTNSSFHVANFQANIVYVGNTTVYSTINTTSFSGTANNTTNAFGKTELNLNVNNALTANSSTFLGTANLSNIQTFITSNAAAAYTNAVAYVDGKSYVNTAQLSSNLANYQTTAGLASNVATLTANNTSFVGSISAANVVSNAQLSSNLANYQTTAGLSANVATLASNSATYANASISNTFTVGTSTYFVSNGNVGIGTTTPDARLAVSGTANVSGNMTIGGNLTTTNVVTVGTSTYFVSNGNVGIGTNGPTFKTTIYGGLLGSTLGSTANVFQIYSATGNLDYINFTKVREAVGSDWTTAAWRIQQVVDLTPQGYIQFNGNGNSQGLIFGTQNAERVRIDSSGNVGIGNTAPNAKLAVTGTANVSGNVVIGGTLTTQSFVANTLGLYNTGTVNAASYTVGTSFIANTTSLYQNGPIYSTNLLLQGDGTNAYIRATTGTLFFGTTSTNYFAVSATGGGSFIPTIDNLYNLGSSTNRFANIYTGDLQLSNEGSEGNDIDHTTGSWTIQEGHENLYLINRKTGKKYMFVLKEV